jgi:hypothetical protein
MTENKTIAQEIDFESESAEVAAIVGVTEDEIASTQKIVGIKPIVRSTTIVKLANGTTVSVNFSRKYNGQIWMREAKNGSAYTWADITIIEFGTPKAERTVTIEPVDYREAYNKSTKTWDIIPGAKIHLNTNRDGMLTRNPNGTFAPVKNVDNPVVALKRDKNGRVIHELVSVPSNVSLLAHVTPKGVRLGERSPLKYVKRPIVKNTLPAQTLISCNQGHSNQAVEIESKVVTRFLTSKQFDGEGMVNDAEYKDVLDTEWHNNGIKVRIDAVKKHLMDKLPEEASDELIEAADKKADLVAGNIVSGFEHCIKAHAKRKAHVLKMEGFRVFRYIKEDSIELSTCLPSDKKTVYECPTCGGTQMWVNENGWTCEKGHMGDDKLVAKTVYVDRYKDDGSGYRQLVDIANDCIKAIEYAFYVASGVKPTKRQFKGSCSSCAHCSARVYGQNQDPIQVSCSKGMRENMVMSDHWELDRSDLVSLGSNFYLSYSEGFDAPSLYGRSRERNRFGNHDKVNRSLWGHSYTQNEIRNIRSKSSDLKGIAAYEVPGWLTFDKLDEMYEAFAKSMLVDLLGEATFDNDRDRYNAYRKTLRGMMGDYLSVFEFGELMYEMKADQDKRALEHDLELDAVADPQDFITLLDMAHPLFRDIVLETAVSRQVHGLYPTTLRDMQGYIQPESNPRMIKAGASQDILMDTFDSNACLEFKWEFDESKTVYGVASDVATNMMANAR